MSLLIAFIINLAITTIWYRLEYQQFGELQWNRKCDNVVSVLYFIAFGLVLANGFSKEKGYGDNANEL